MLGVTSSQTVSVPPTLFMLLTASATGSSSSSTPFPPSVTSHRNYFLLFPITETTTSLTLRLLPSYNSHIANAQRRRRYGNVRSIHDIRGGAVGDDGTGSSTYPPSVGGYDTNNSDGPTQAIPPSPPQLSSLLQSQHQQQYDHIMTEGPGNNTNNHHQNTYSQLSSSSEEYGNNNNNNNYYISDADPMLYEYRETVEARIDAWRRQQHVSGKRHFINLFEYMCGRKFEISTHHLSHLPSPRYSPLPFTNYYFYLSKCNNLNRPSWMMHPHRLT